jgi:hypothetical protein
MTSIQWLFNNLKSHFEHDGDLLEVVKMSFEQAKEMHKQEIIDTFFEGAYGGDNISAEQYYKETFKKD